MYEEFFGLKEKPFSIVPNPAILYPGEKHTLALTYLEYGLTEGSGFILLTGEVGTGKTTLIRHLLNDIQKEMNVAALFNATFSEDDLVRFVMQEFEIEPLYDEKAKNMEALNDYLIEAYSRNQRCLLIVDEAQNLSHRTLEEVRMLSNLQAEDHTLLQICLVGQPELRERLQQPELSQLAQRVTISYHLGPLSQEEVHNYIEHRLRAAGAKRLNLFDNAAIDAIYEYSKGIPRLINVLCDSCLVYAYADELPQVTAPMVKQVLEDRFQEGLLPAATLGSPARLRYTEGGGDYDALTSRLAALESSYDKMWATVQWQGQELEKRIDKERDVVVRTLKKLLDDERKKNERLLVQLGKMHEELASRKSNPVAREEFSLKQEAPEPQKKPGLFGKFRGR